jgi:uncharacterized protein YueI
MDNLDIFDNPKIKSSLNTEQPTKTGLYLVYALDKAINKTDYYLVYFREDTKKFYLHKDYYKTSDLESYWKIIPEAWAFLREIDISEFEDK